MTVIDTVRTAQEAVPRRSGLSAPEAALLGDEIAELIVEVERIRRDLAEIRRMYRGEVTA